MNYLRNSSELIKLPSFCCDQDWNWKKKNKFEDINHQVLERGKLETRMSQVKVISITWIISWALLNIWWYSDPSLTSPNSIKEFINLIVTRKLSVFENMLQITLRQENHIKTLKWYRSNNVLFQSRSDVNFFQTCT